MQQLTASKGGTSKRYELINEEYRIASCRIGDLSGEQAAAMLEQFGGDRLSTLTVFYDQGEDMLVLNREHKYYEQYRRIVELYMQSPAEAQELFNGQGESGPIAELRRVLDSCLLARHNSREMFILGRHKVCTDYDITCSMLQVIRKRHGEHGLTWLMYMVYQYGVIQGKRADRARRIGKS